MPGKTITINFYDVDKKLFLVDLPGYGYAKRQLDNKQAWSSLTDGYFTQNKNIDRLSLVLQLVDSRIGPTADDEMMMDFLRASGLPYIVVLTKADKLNKTERGKILELIETHPLTSDVPHVLFSSLSGEGKNELWKFIYEYTGV